MIHSISCCTTVYLLHGTAGSSSLKKRKQQKARDEETYKSGGGKSGMSQSNFKSAKSAASKRGSVTSEISSHERSGSVIEVKSVREPSHDMEGGETSDI